MKKEVVQYLWILNIWLVCARKSWVLTSLWTKYETCKDRKTCKSPSWSHCGCSHVKRKVHCVNLPALMLQWSSSTTSTRMDFTLVRPYSFEYRLQFFSQQFIFQRKKTTLSSFKFSHLSFPYRKAACLIVVPFQMVGSGSSREQPGFRLQWLWLWLLTVCLRRQGSLKIISMFG